MSAYWGAVEAQGRGTLHIHMLLWVRGTPDMDVFRKRMSEDIE